MERPVSLLLVEDEHRLRHLVAQFLRTAGYAITEAAHGLEGLQQFREMGPFDLLLVDLNLPIMGGVELCRNVRQTAPLQPILVCSAAIHHDVELDLRAIGVRDFLTKPYHPDALLERLARLVAPDPLSATA
jgi:DNA-binding response OmpR family regulator